MDISIKILSDPVNNWVFKNAETELYLVGGYLRDILLGRTAYDTDYVLKKGARNAAHCFARKFRVTLIELKEEQTFRVVLRNGRIVDFNNF